MFRKALFFLLILLSAFIALYPKFPLAEVYGTYVAIRLEDIFIAAILMIWFFVNLKRIPQILNKPIYQAIFLFWLIGLLSLLSALFITFSVKPHLGFLHWLRRVEYMSLFFIAATMIKTQGELKLYLSSMIIVAILVIVYGFGQVYLGLPVISTENREFSKGLILQLTPGARVNSTFAGQYDLAAFLTVVLIFISTFLFSAKLKFKDWNIKKIFQKLTLMTAGGLGFALLGLTASRISFASTFVGIALSLFLLGRKFLILGLILISLISVVAIPQLRHRLVATLTVNLLQGGGPKFEPPTVEEKPFSASASANPKEATLSATNSGLPIDIAPGEPINTTELGVYRSLNIRLNVEWPRAIMALEKNPLLGTGYSSITIATDNDILRILGETGILGLAAIVLIFTIITKALIKGLKTKAGFEKLFLLATLCSMGAIFVTTIFIDVLEASKIASLLWILLGIAYAVSLQEDDRKS